MKSLSEILKDLAVGAKKILWILGLHAFSLILFFIFIDIILGGFLFYKYALLADQKQPVIVEKIIKFDDKTYQEVLEKMQSDQGIVSPAPDQE